MVFLDETLGVRHQAEGTTARVLQAGDGECRTVEIVSVGEGDIAIGEIRFRIAGESDETTFGVSDGQLEGFRKSLEVRTGRIFHFEFCPAANEALAGVVDQATGGQDAEFGENLKAIANAEGEAAASVVILDGIAEFGFSDELREATRHHVVAVAEAARKCHQLGFFNVCYRGVGDGHDRGGEADQLQGAGGFGITIGAGIFEQSGVRHSAE